MVKLAVKLDNGKMLIVLGIVEGNLQRILAGDPLVTNLGFAGKPFSKYVFVLYHNPHLAGTQMAADEMVRVARTLGSLVRPAIACTVGVNKTEIAQLRGGLFDIQVGDRIPGVEKVKCFYGKTEDAIEKMLRDANLITERTEVIDERKP